MSPIALTGHKEPVYELVCEETFDACIACMRETFSTGEPMTRLLGITKEEFDYFARVFTRKAMAESLGVIARDPVTNEVLGFCISEDYATEPPAESEFVSPKFEPITQMLDQLGNRFRQAWQVGIGEFIHVFLMGINKKCRNRNVSRQLVRESLLMARQRGYRGAVAETTSALSTRVAERNGFYRLHAMAYNEFTFQEQSIFSALGERAQCCLMYADLNAVARQAVKIA